MQYFTEEYFDALVDRLNGDDGFQETTEGFSAQVVQVAEDRGDAFLLEIDDGTVSAEAVDADTEADFRFVANYDDWAKVVQGEESAEKLIMKGAMQVDGKMSDLLKHRDKFEYLTKTGRDLSPDV